MKKGNFTAEDLDASLKGLTNLIGSVSDTPESIDRWYANQMLDSEIETPAEYAARIGAITREQVIAAALMVEQDTIYMLAGTLTEEEESDEE